MSVNPGSSVGELTVNFPARHKWHFAKEEILQSASIREGFSMEKELRYRQQATRFIQEMVDHLNHNVKDQRGKISQLCMCAAIIHMHRFFYFHSFKFFDFRDVAAACLFLAGKSEESPRKLEHIVRVWWAKKFPKHPTIPSNNHYFEASQLIVQLENIVLQTIAFDLKIDLPHPVVLTAMHEIAKGNKKLTEVAYFFATDVLCVTNWGIRFSAAAIACVCVHIVCIYAGYEILEPEAGSLPWYKNVDPSMTYQVLDEMADEFAGIYRECKDNLALTRFASKGIVQPSRGRQASPSDKGSILPPPPPPPTFHKRVDISEYKERNKAASTSDHSISDRPGTRKSFMPDTSQVRSDISMSHPSLLNQEPLSLAMQTVINGRKEEHVVSVSRREEEKRRDKDRERRKEDREERERRRDERPEDRDRRREDERRKREHDRISGHSTTNSYLTEKRIRSDALSNSFVPSSTVNMGSTKIRPTTQVASSSISALRNKEREGLKIASRHSAAVSRRPSSPVNSRLEVSRALSPPPQPPVVLSPPPPPPLYAELEDGELE